ncbi:MAG: bifunctional diguanylate cyclase/phosphodiesterase, partial [Pontibacterium sp.]
SLSATYVLAQEVRQNKGIFEGFDEYAKEVIRSVSGISNLQLAPNGIISHIAPLEGNELALGHDILKSDSRQAEAKLAIDQKQLTLAGPFSLIQGGFAIIGRNPIFLRNEAGEEYFWGFASALIYVDDLIKSTDLSLLEGKGYSYTLSRNDPVIGAPYTFASASMPLSYEALAATVKVPNGEWLLMLSLPHGYYRELTALAAALSVLIALLVTFQFRRILLHPALLQQVVDEQTKELKQLATYDSLTHLPNRRYLNEQAERVCMESQRYHTPAAFLIIDLDDFKKINDVFGHAMGDQVLKEVSKRLKACVRESDLVARLGGDEFAVLLHHTGNEFVLNNIIHSINKVVCEPIEIYGQAFTVSTSIGVAVLPKDGPDFASTYRHADMAMYAAKEKGKNSYHFYNEALQESAIEKLNIQAALAQAAVNNEFRLLLQPIVYISNGIPAGYEALIRWQHPQRGFLTPDKFIDIAEETNAIFDLGYWVIEEACRLIKEHKVTQWVSVNLSPKQFNDARLVRKIGAIINKYDIDPSLLELEVTESCLIDDSESAIKTLHKIKALGLTIALDDFGTGYSSLSLLKQLPVDILKIDRSFVTELETDTRDRNIVTGMNTMAHQLGIRVVAEGIETVTQLALLKRMGCDYGQGYYFSKPLPPAQILADPRASLGNLPSEPARGSVV